MDAAGVEEVIVDLIEEGVGSVVGREFRVRIRRIFGKDG